MLIRDTKLAGHVTPIPPNIRAYEVRLFLPDFGPIDDQGPDASGQPWAKYFGSFNIWEVGGWGEIRCATDLTQVSLPALRKLGRSIDGITHVWWQRWDADRQLKLQPVVVKL